MRKSQHILLILTVLLGMVTIVFLISSIVSGDSGSAVTFTFIAFACFFNYLSIRQTIKTDKKIDRITNE